MEHYHAHDHNHSVEPADMNVAFITGIVLNFLFVVVEAIVGFSIHSLSLLSDAGHNLADVGALALSLLAYKLLKVKSAENFTYGYRKTSILVALFNAVVLLLSIGAIVYEAVARLFNPQPMPGTTIAWVAAIGIAVNFISALLFRKNRNSDLNQKSAYLHLMSDAVVSLAIVIGGIIIQFTKWFWIDSLLSIIVAIVILVNTWSLLKDSLRLTLDGVPDDINIDDVKKIAMKITGVKDLHHIHVWALSTAENALTAHLVLQNNIDTNTEQGIKDELRHNLHHINIQHITLETERESEPCATKIC